MLKKDDYNKNLNNMAYNLKKEYKKLIKSKIVNDVIFRSITPSVSKAAEDQSAIFLKNIFNNEDYYYLLDHQYGNRRPDIMVLKKENENLFILKYIFEIKSNVGYCRKICASDYDVNLYKKDFVITKYSTSKDRVRQMECNILKPIEKKSFFYMIENKKIKIKCSEQLKVIILVISSENVGKTHENDNIKFHKNKVKAEFNSNIDDVRYYVLFKNWYDNLEIFEDKNSIFDSSALYKDLSDFEKLKNNKINT